MIQLNCTNCKALLQIDDAFAGGVCRCRYCGTIQTVPRHLKKDGGNGNAVTQQVAVGSGKSAKTLYQKKSTIDPGGAGSGTGLDDLAGIVASSGLTSKRLQKKSPSAAKPSSLPRDKRTLIVVISAAAVILVLLGIIIVMAMRDKSTGEMAQAPNPNAAPPANPAPPGNTGNPGGANVASPIAPTPPVTNGPNFLGEPLDENSIVYILDRGDASKTENRLDLMKQAVINSVKTLGPDRRFAVVFFYLDGDKPKAFPPDGLLAATPANIADLQTFLDDIYGVGGTMMSNSVKHAAQTGAEAAVFVPIKAFVNDGFPGAVISNRGKRMRIHCVTLAQAHLAPVMKKIAQATGGTYRDVTIPELRAAAQ